MAGRPLKYQTPEDMQADIDAYFAECFDKEKPPTVSGLALSLDMDRRTLVDYAHRDAFFPTVKKARARIEETLETSLYGNGVAGVIFNLKNNFGWKDKTEQELSGSVEVKKIERTIVDPSNTNS